MQLHHVIHTHKTDEDIAERLASFRLTPVVRFTKGDGTELVASDIRGDRPDGTFSVTHELAVLNSIYAGDDVSHANISYAIRGDHPSTPSRLRDENTTYTFEMDRFDTGNFNPFIRSDAYIRCDHDETDGYVSYEDFSYAFRHAAWLLALYAEPHAFVLTNKTTRVSHVTPSESVAFDLLDREIENGVAPDTVHVTRVTYDETTNAVLCTRVEAKTVRQFEAIKTSRG